MQWFPPLLRAPFRWYMPHLLAFWAGTTPSQIQISSYATQSCPMMFIVGDHDDRVTVNTTHVIAATFPTDFKEVLIVPDARHGKGHAANPALYERHVLDFLNRVQHP